MTYTKKLNEITITTADGNTITLTDTASDPVASLALAQFKHGGDVMYDNEGTVTIIPISAIVSVAITSLEDAEVEKEMPCEE